MGTNKTVYGLLAFGPIGLILVSIFAIIAMVAAEVERHSSEPPVMFFAFVGLIFIASILSLVSLILYIIHISKNPRIDEGARIGWIIGMVFAHGIVCIVYFFMHIVNEPPMSDYPPQQQPKGPW